MTAVGRRSGGEVARVDSAPGLVSEREVAQGGVWGTLETGTRGGRTTAGGA